MKLQAKSAVKVVANGVYTVKLETKNHLRRWERERATNADDCRCVSVSVQCKGYNLIRVTTLEASETTGTTALVYLQLHSRQLIYSHCTCSLPLWRVHEIKCMYFASRTHGLFITYTQFRLLITSRQLLYTYTQVDNIFMAQYPFFCSPCQFLVNPLFHSPLLTWKPSFGVMRSCPPWPQVARKLTSPSSFPPHSKFPTPQGFPEPIVRLTKTTSQSRLPRSGTVHVLSSVAGVHPTGLTADQGCRQVSTDVTYKWYWGCKLT